MKFMLGEEEITPFVSSEILRRDKEITRLTTELEQARNQIQFMHTYEESTLRLSDSYKQRAEAAEQQVAALVEALQYLRNVAYTKDGITLAAYIDYDLATFSNRAKKIQAVVEAAIAWERDQNADEQSIETKLRQAVRDLES